MEQVTSYLDNFIQYEMRINILQTVLIILILWAIKKATVKLVFSDIEGDLKKQYHGRKTIEYILVIIGLLLVGNIWISNFQSITTFLGLLSAGIAIALKDIFVNIAGWLFIFWRKPFDIGDRIQVGDSKGDVVDLRLFQFSLLEVGSWVDAEQSTGRILHIPNSVVFTMPQANYSQGFDYIWNEQHLYISLDSDQKKAQAILLDIMNELMKDDFKKIEREFRKAKKDFFIAFTQYTPTVYIDINERGIQLSLRYLCSPRKRRIIQHQVTQAILDRLRSEKNIKIVYPITSIILDKPGERK